MKVPLSWLRDHVAIDVPTTELAERLSVSTCEVERISFRGVPDTDGNLGLYRVGKVLEAGKHPNADRLQLCSVDVGEAEPRQIVCGAWNFGAGATVAVALPGAVLPDGRTLERAKLRGTVSDGMILSEKELELGPDHGGILVFEQAAEPGTPLADVLPVGEEVLEIEVTGNRPDLLSVYGVAREVAALFELELGPFPGGEETGTAGDEQVEIRIDDLEGCPLYIGRLFRDVEIGPSPPWLRARIHAAGMRPISNVVDVTNYVMHELGSPLHAFDYDTLHEGRIVVRRAAPGEEVRTLDGQLRKLDTADLVIADADRAIALAGIMGGAETEVTETTTNVLLEAANFEPIGILKSSERLGLRTDGSNRWEKGVDPYLAAPSAVLATRLIVETAGAKWAGESEARGTLPERPVVHLRPARTDEIVGMAIDPGEQRGILERLGFEVTDDCTVTVPTWRARDVTREIDLVEEIARFRLDDVPFTLPKRSAMFGRLTRGQALRRVVEEVLVGCGVSEAYTSSLVPEDPDPRALRIPVPISADYAVLRTTLLPSLLDSIRRNLDAGNPDPALFEIARVYLPSGEELPVERWRVGAILPGGFLRAKGAVETLYRTLHTELRVEPGRSELLHPGQTATLDAGVIGALRPGLLEGEWGAFELDLETVFAGIPERILYGDVLTFPPLRQDLAFAVADDVPAGDLAEAAREAAGPELREMRAFDVYRGEQVGPGRKSIAFAVTFQSPERTLSDEDAAVLRGKIVEALRKRFGAELRA